jgi:hypothetical protein
MTVVGSAAAANISLDHLHSCSGISGQASDIPVFAGSRCRIPMAPSRVRTDEFVREIARPKAIKLAVAAPIE